MLRWLNDKHPLTTRQSRLFNVACWQSIKPRMLAKAQEQSATHLFNVADTAIQIAERYADGKADDAEQRRAAL
jgi:hypothetical protein